MERTELYSSKSPRQQFSVSPHSSRRHFTCVPGILFVSCTFLGATECHAQDVAETARQERARKESQAKPSKHVYTEEDLKHSRILTPEDRAQAEARRKLQNPPSAEKPAEVIDANADPAKIPLGDVARRLRQEKQARQLLQSQEFHLPSTQPALASPKPPPLLPPALNPALPRLVPSRPFVKRSPFARPQMFTPDPPRVVPSQPTVRTAPTASPMPRQITVQRGDSLWKLALQNLGRGSRWHDLVAANPWIADPARIEAGARIYVPANATRVRPESKIKVHIGDTLSKIAQTQYGRAGCWRSIAQANSQITNADRIYEGQEFLLPAQCDP